MSEAVPSAAEPRASGLRGLLRRPALLLAWRFARSAVGARRLREELHRVERYCLFVGHPRSGHSIVGALLDAHRHAVVSDELDALHHLRRGFGRDQLLYLSIDRARRQAAGGRRKMGRGGRTYSYRVPGQWQGRYEALRVVGDSAAGLTLRQLAGGGDLLHRLDRTMLPSATVFIHVVRNPYDNISTMVLRGGRTFDDAIGRYFDNCAMLVALRERAGSERVATVRHEEIVTDAPDHLSRLCGFLGLDAPAEYLDACAGILYSSPSQSRHAVQWSASDLDRVAREIDRYGFLEGYTFEG